MPDEHHMTNQTVHKLNLLPCAGVVAQQLKGIECEICQNNANPIVYSPTSTAMTQPMTMVGIEIHIDFFFFNTSELNV